MNRSRRIRHPPWHLHCSCTRQRLYIRRFQHRRTRRCRSRLLRSLHHTRPRRRVGCRHSRSRQQGCQSNRTRRSHLGRCTRRKRRARPRSRPRRHRFRRCPHRCRYLRKHHKRRSDCRRSRNRSPGCRCHHTRHIRQPGCQSSRSRPQGCRHRRTRRTRLLGGKCRRPRWHLHCSCTQWRSVQPSTSPASPPNVPTPSKGTLTCCWSAPTPSGKTWKFIWPEMSPAVVTCITNTWRLASGNPLAAVEHVPRSAREGRAFEVGRTGRQEAWRDLLRGVLHNRRICGTRNA